MPRYSNQFRTAALDSASVYYREGYHHLGTTYLLQQVDADFSSTNIKNAVTIFGKNGSYSQVATHDIEGAVTNFGVTTSVGAVTICYTLSSIGAGLDYDLNSLTQVYAANSLAEAFGNAILASAAPGSTLKLRLYMNGVQVAESAFIGLGIGTIAVNGNAALSGNKIVKIAIHNYDVGIVGFTILGSTNFIGDPYASAVFCGSVKVV